MRSALTVIGTAMVLSGFALYVVTMYRPSHDVGITQVYAKELSYFFKTRPEPASSPSDVERWNSELRGLLEVYAGKFDYEQRSILHIAVALQFTGALMAIFFSQGRKGVPTTGSC